MELRRCDHFLTGHNLEGTDLPINAPRFTDTVVIYALEMHIEIVQFRI